MGSPGDPPFWHAWGTHGAGALQHQHRVFVHIQLRIINAGGHLRMVGENQGPPSTAHTLGRGGAELDHRTAWGYVAAQHG